MTTDNHDERLNYLDGLRGFAACWVMIGHSLMATKSDLFLLSQPHYAVDLFMLISGFLMYYHAINRADREPLNDPRSWVIFWTRRLFRIAPVYYVMLAIAFVAEPHLAIWMQDYQHKNEFFDRSWQNILAHYTFVFGVIPRFHHETALPDWSIWLEMQFYAVFPFIWILLSRIGPIKGSAILTACCCLFWAAFPSFMGSFVMAPVEARRTRVRGSFSRFAGRQDPAPAPPMPGRLSASLLSSPGSSAPLRGPLLCRDGFDRAGRGQRLYLCVCDDG
jgi:peptidoglycan/LPS O-acetylase OafA/YrhL